MATQTIGVVGAGVMGSEIAHVAAATGHDVVMVDIDDAAIARGVARISSISARRVERGRMSSDEATAIAGRVTTATRHEALRDCALVIEAAPEILDVKTALWGSLDAVARPDAILASNTSGLSITTLARATSRPDRALGLHFFNPASVMRLVEVIRGTDTSDATLATGMAAVAAFGKEPVAVTECPGFLVNRILVRALTEAYRAAEEFDADRSSADAAVVATGPAPMGPFALGDLIGLDTTLHVQRDLEAHYGDRFAAGTSLAATVAAGDLGQKTGSGFVAGRPETGGDSHGEAVAERYYLGAFDEACRCREESIAAVPDIDRAMQLGAGWETGPLAWADAAGWDAVHARLAALSEITSDRFTPRAALRERRDRGEPFITTQENDE
jgi:3-hydroxyacyl-CoA dehydrogenase